jgi:hypothetical protein
LVFEEIVRENLEKIKDSCLQVCKDIASELINIKKDIKIEELTESYIRLGRYINDVNFDPFDNLRLLRQ